MTVGATVSRNLETLNDKVTGMLPERGTISATVLLRPYLGMVLTFISQPFSEALHKALRNISPSGKNVRPKSCPESFSARMPDRMPVMSARPSASNDTQESGLALSPRIE